MASRENSLTVMIRFASPDGALHVETQLCAPQGSKVLRVLNKAHVVHRDDNGLCG